jgi:hypothetical protein
MNKWDSRRTEAARIKRNQAAFSRNEKVKAGLLPPLEAAPAPAPAPTGWPFTQDDVQRQRRDDIYNAAQADAEAKKTQE